MTLSSIDFEAKSAEELLRWSMDQYGVKAGLASSFGMEDMVLIDMIAKLDGPLTIFTLDTGRLHEETYEVMDRVRSKYGLEIKTYFPDHNEVELGCDNFKTREEMNDWFAEGHFAKNFYGYGFDPEDVYKWHHEGVSDAKIFEETYQGDAPDSARRLTCLAWLIAG